MSEESHYKYKTACNDCGSSDACAVYSNDSTYCFSCQKATRSNQAINTEAKTSGNDLSSLVFGDTVAIPDRGLDADTCRRYGYQVNEMIREDCDTHIAPYHDENGALCAQHLRFVGDKGSMPFKGTNPKTMQMFGQKHFASGTKRLVICEGEIDTMSTYQALGKTWAVVGIPGAERVEKALKANLQFVESFDEVVLFFDNDDAGRAATSVALQLLPFGKVKYIKEFPEGCKDANDILVKLGPKLLRETVFYKAQEYIPDGVVDAADVVFEPDSFEISMYPWNSWNKKLYARRGGELTVYTAGTGIGKSTILRAIYSDLMKQGEKCAVIMLEESIAETKADLMSSVIGKPIRKILAQRAVNSALEKKGKPILFEDVEELTPEDLLAAEAEVDASGLLLIDHSKGYNIDSILSQIRFLAKSKGVKHVLLDHITILLSSDAEIDNEVKALDVTMAKLRVLCEEENINLDMISHIRKRSSGMKSANSGAQIAIEELRGSGSLTQIADNIITLERCQQDPDDSNLTVCRSLKSRLGGFTGEIGRLRYDPDTGELTEEEYVDDGGFSKQDSDKY